MTRGVRVIAPAKINWTLEALRVRPDGYHEIRSVLQTIDLHDTLVAERIRGDDVEIVLRGDAGPLADEPARRNLAYRAAASLREHAGIRAGARLTIEKRIPLAAGLGGGSSNAAAALRACNVLWECAMDDATLMSIAAEIGSDVPFFIAGGTAAVSGRGEVVRPLRDAQRQRLVIGTPREQARAHKTAAMYAALSPDDFSEGYVTIGVRETVEAHRGIDDAEMANVFERVLSRRQPETELAMDALRAQGALPHLCGAGPSFFVLLGPRVRAQTAIERIERTGFQALAARTLGRRAARRIETL